MEDQYQKFLVRNENNFVALNDYIIANRSNILRLIVSPEMYEYLKSYEQNNTDEYVRYRDIRVIRDVYAPAKSVKFLLKNTPKIDFNLPCVCGYFNDEPHP